MSIRIFLFLWILLLPNIVQADSKVSAMTEDTTPSGTDLLYTVKDPATTPVSRRSTIRNVTEAGFNNAITANGTNIGVGTEDPQAKLDVNGAIYGRSNVGIGTAAPAAGLQVGPGSSSLGATLSSTGALIKGNLEVDGKIYGDGSLLTNTPIPSGVVTSVTGTYPVTSTGGTAPVISVDLSPYPQNTRTISTTPPLYGGGNLSADRIIYETRAGPATDGYLAATDWVTFNAKQPAGSYLTAESDPLALAKFGTLNTGKWCSSNGSIISCTEDAPGGGSVTSVTASAPVASSGGTTPNITISQASGSTNGYLSSGDWTTFNNKQPAGSYLTSESDTLETVTGRGASSTNNIGLGTTAPATTLQVGTGAKALSATLPSGSALVKGNLEVDGKLYGDGSALTNLPSSSEADTLATVTARGNVTTTNVGIGTTTAPGNTLTIYKASGSNSDMALGDGDVGHGVTTLAATTTWLLLNEHTTEKGGAQLTGFSDASDNPAMEIKGVNVADPDANIPAIIMDGYAANGTGTQALGNTKTVMQVQNNGTALVSVLGVGNVGIGSILPGSKLDVDGGVYISGNVGIGTSSPRARVEINRGATILPGSNPQFLIKGNLEVDGKIYGDGSGLIGIDTSGGDITGTLTTNKIVKGGSTSNTVNTDSNIWSIGTNGNVGVGDSTPDGVLEIVKSGSLKSLLVSSSASTDGDYLTVNSGGNLGVGTNTPNATLEVQKNARPLLMLSSSGSTNGDYVIVTSVGNFGIGTTAPVGLLDVNRKLTVLSGGNVGIGSVTPRGRLDIGTGSYYGDGSHLTDVTMSWPNQTTTVSGYQSGYTESPKTYNNTYDGYQCGFNGNGGIYNDASGIYSLTTNVSGGFNNCHGAQSCQLMTTSNNNASGAASQYYGAGTENDSSGYESMQGTGTYSGSYNQCGGAWCMLNISTNAYDSCDGYKCLYTASSGGYNRGGGAFSLYYLSDGTYNYAGGYEAGMYIADGVNANSSSDYGVFLGAKTKALASTDTNFYVLGSNTIGLGSNTGSIGDSNVTKHVFNAGNVGIGSTSPRQKLDIVGSVYVSSDVSALTFTDRTPGYTGNALEAISTIKTDEKGNIDHASLPDFVKVKRGDQDERSLGAMITLLTKAVQELQDENKRIREEIEADWIKQFNKYIKEMYGNIISVK
jgi:hypothetical protein